METYDRALESLSPSQLRERQWQQVQSLLARVASRSDFYRERFAAAGVRPEEIKAPRDMLRIPVMRKEDVLEDIASSPPYGRRLEVQRAQIEKVIESSGSTGLGREIQALTAADVDAFEQLSSFGLRWIGVGAGTVVMNTVPMTTTGAGQTYSGGLRRLGANAFAIGMYDAVRKLDCMRRFGAEVLVATPSYLRRLEVVAREQGMTPRSLNVKSLVVAGEAYSSEFGLAREQAWGARLYEQYGSTQRAAAWSCERGALPDGQRGVLHNLSHLTLCEVIDPRTGEHVADGERGELVVSTLRAEATPLIRYATSDSVRYIAGGSCPCGRPFEGFEAGTVKRIDSMMKVRGVNLWPETVDGIVFADERVRDYRGEVAIGEAGNEELRLTVEAAAGEEAALASELRAKLRRGVGLSFEVDVAAAGALQGDGDSFAKSSRWNDTRKKADAKA